MMSERGILKKSKLTSTRFLVERETTQTSDRVEISNVVRFTDPFLGSPVDQGSGERDIIFNIVGWNTHNCDIFTQRESLLQMRAHILILQEVNKQMWNRDSGIGYKWFIKQRNDKALGIAILGNMVAKRREDLESLNSLIVQIFFNNTSIFIGSIHQTLDRTEFRTLLQMMQQFPLILGGDLNVQVRSLSICGFKWYAVKKDPSKKLKNNFLNSNQKNQKKIDYIFYNQIFRIDQKEINTPLDKNNKIISDHNPIRVWLRMDRDIRMEFPFFDQFEAKWAIEQELYRFKNILEMLKFSNSQIPSIKIVKFQIPNFQKQDDVYKLKLQKMINEDKKKYHDIIKHTSGLGKSKKGSIINILSINDNTLITNYKQINSECTKYLIKISDELNKETKRIWQWQNEIKAEDIDSQGFEYLQIPNLQTTSKEEKKKINQENGYFQYKWPLRGDKYDYYNKAISYDWSHLSVIRKMWEDSGRQDFSFMNLSYLKSLNYSLQMRIIPINKIAPQIPTGENMRPIIVMSHAIKMIELFYEERLKQYVNWEINPEQIGFIQGMGTHIHVQEIIRFLRQKGIPGKTATFIDLSNAYNVVDREKLYLILEQRKIFGKKALDFLFSLYDELYFEDKWDNKRIYVKNGLHQGSILSPYLFDIYFDELINQWKQGMKQEALKNKLMNKKKIEQQIRNVRILAYADDVVFLNNKLTSDLSFKIFYEQAQRFNFKINLKKPNFISQSKNQNLAKLGCNWVESYKYLGVWINIRGSLKPHYQIMKKIVKKNSWRIKALSKLLPARHIFKLWQVYVKPYFDYISTALWLQKNPIIKQFQSLWRSCLRIMSGMHKCSKNIYVQKLFGQISFFGEEDQFLRWQEESDLNRWLNQEIKNLENYYKYDGNEQNKLYIYKIEPKIRSRITIFAEKMKKDLEQKRREISLNRQFVIPMQDEIPQWNSNIIRKIPNYYFFDFFKYDSMLCKECKKQLTLQHIDQHFNTHFEVSRNTIYNYITNSRDFNKSEQKQMNNFAKKRATLLNKQAQKICEKRVYEKKKNQIQK